MAKDRNITWFIFTTDSHTNESIAKEPGEKTSHDEMRCADGKKRPLWECEGSFITRIIRSKKTSHLVFDIYKREGLRGPIKKATFLGPRKTKKVASK